MGVASEVSNLEKTFREDFRFSTEIWDIPSQDSEDELVRKFVSFRKGRLKGSLIILYYAGHGGGDPQECIWSAYQRDNSPELNWHSVQGLVLEHQTDTLVILDCCFAALAVKNVGKGDNWFLGASTKENVAAGVSWKSFTSALIRKLKRAAEIYWLNGKKVSVQTIDHDLGVWEQDLLVTPKLTRLTDHDCDPTDLTPLSNASPQPLLTTSSTEPVREPVLQASQKSLPLRHRPNHATLPPGQNPMNWKGQVNARELIPIELPIGDFQTVRFSKMPQGTELTDLMMWIEDRLASEARIIKIGPITGTVERTTIATFANVAQAKKVLSYSGTTLQRLNGRVSAQVSIEAVFQGLTTIFSSTNSPDKQPTLDVVVVHGAYGHPVNSFACHYIDPNQEGISVEEFWPRDSLPKVLEAQGVFPRVLTYGWPASTWLESQGNATNFVDNFVSSLNAARVSSPKRPLVFIGHGIGGVLIKQAVGEIINFGFNYDDFENPVRLCSFIATPHRGVAQENDFSPLLANMRAALSPLDLQYSPLVKSLRSRNSLLMNTSREFESLRSEWGIGSISFAEDTKIHDYIVVPQHCASLTDIPGKNLVLHTDHINVAKLPRAQNNLDQVLKIIVDEVAIELGLSEASNAAQPISEKKKEEVYAQLQNYDTFFLVDDSDSMEGRRWQTASKVLAKIASIAEKYDDDGVDVKFFNKRIVKKQRVGLKSSEVMKLFEKASPPNGGTLTANVLDEVLNEYMYEYDEDRDRKGLNLIVLTDGDPDPEQDVEGVLVKYANSLRAARAPLLKVGVQFVQIGNDERAKRFLERLDDDLKEKYKLDRDVRRSSTPVTSSSTLPSLASKPPVMGISFRYYMTSPYSP